MAFNLSAAHAARNGATSSASSPPNPEAQQPDQTSPASQPESTDVDATSRATQDLTVASVCELVENFVEILSRKHLATFPGLIAVTGRIDSLPPATKYPWHYDVVIAGGASTFYLELPKGEVEAKGITKGSHVRVIGRIVLKTWQGSIKPRLVVTQVDSIDAPELAAGRASQMATLAKVHELRKIRHGFPIKDRLKIAVICGRSSQVLEDFQGSLKEVANSVQVEAIQVSITNEPEIAQAISSARADIIAVIRGGGPESEFAVFDSEPVLLALAAAASYRIVALGHSQHQTMSDLIADYSADTPTAAGQFIREQMRALLARLMLQRKALETEFARSQVETRERDPKPYVSEMRTDRRPMPRKVQRPRSKGPLVVLLVIAAGLLLAYAKSRLFP